MGTKGSQISGFQISKQKAARERRPPFAVSFTANAQFALSSSSHAAATGGLLRRTVQTREKVLTEGPPSRTLRRGKE